MGNHLLTDSELKKTGQELSKWKLADSKLERKFIFPNFIEAFGFMSKVAIIAESIGHHPDWSNCYSSVKIQLTTHDLGGISNLDIKLASKIDELVIGM